MSDRSHLIRSRLDESERSTQTLIGRGAAPSRFWIRIAVPSIAWKYVCATKATGPQDVAHPCVLHAPERSSVRVGSGFISRGLLRRSSRRSACARPCPRLAAPAGCSETPRGAGANLGGHVRERCSRKGVDGRPRIVVTLRCRDGRIGHDHSMYRSRHDERIGRRLASSSVRPPATPKKLYGAGHDLSVGRASSGHARRLYPSG